MLGAVWRSQSETNTCALVDQRPPDGAAIPRLWRSRWLHHVTALTGRSSAARSEPTHTPAAWHSQIEAGVFHGRGARQSQGPVVWRGEGLGKWERTAFTSNMPRALKGLLTSSSKISQFHIFFTPSEDIHIVFYLAHVDSSFKNHSGQIWWPKDKK